MDLSPVPHIFTSMEVIWDQPADQNFIDCPLLVSCSSMTLDHILSVSQLTQSRTFTSSISLILHTCLTTYLWAIQRGSGWKCFPIWRQYVWSTAWVAMYKAIRIFFINNADIRKQWRRCSKCNGGVLKYLKKESCNKPLCTKLASEKHFKVIHLIHNHSHSS
jgi:hypothetical protein